MNNSDIRPGMKVLIKRSTYTEINQGMDEAMYDMVGKQKTISEIGVDDQWVKFQGDQFTWDLRDITEIPQLDENEIKLKGEKSVFDPTELH